MANYTLAAGTGLGLSVASSTLTVAVTDAELAAIAGLTSAANKLPYFTGSGTAALADITSAGRSMLAAADAAAQKTLLGVSGTNTGDQNVFSTIAVSGQSNVVADSATDTLTLVAGSNITITTDASTDSITIAASGGGGGTPGGSTTQVQYNSSGSFAGSSGFTYDADGGLSLQKSLSIGGAMLPGFISLSEGSENGTNKITLSANGNIASDFTLYLPVADGTNGQVLQTNGSGELSFATVSGGGSPGGSDTQVQFNSSSAFSGDSGFTYAGSGSATLTTALTIGGNSTAAGKLVLKEDSDNGSNTVTLQAPASVSSDVTFTLPSADGTNGQVLQTNGSGTLSFASAGSGALVKIATYSVSSNALASAAIFDNATYSKYTIVLDGVKPTASYTNYNVQIRFAKSGTTFDSGSVYYGFGRYASDDGGVTNYTTGNGIGVTELTLTSNCGSDHNADQGYYGTLELQAGITSTSYTSVRWFGHWSGSGSSVMRFAEGQGIHKGSGGGCTAIQVLVGGYSDRIQTGTMTVYGYLR